MNVLTPMPRANPDIEWPPQPPHSEFLGLRFCLLSQAETVQAIVWQCGEPYRYIVTPNVHDIVTAHDEPAELMPIYLNAWLSLCDSRIVRKLARLEKRALPLVTGSDLVAALLTQLNRDARRRTPKRVLIVGPPRRTETALRKIYPLLNVTVLPAPAGLAQDAELRRAVARQCVSHRWDIALLCLGCPTQGFIAREIAALGCQSGVALCVGASVDFLTGARRRAPLWMQHLCLEWAHRLIMEPRRLWRRYLVQSPNIAHIFLGSWMNWMRGRETVPIPTRRPDIRS